MKHLSIYSVLFFLSANLLFAQELSVDSIISNFRDYAANYPVEKIYLHLDKPYYASGEYMYFRAYLTDMNLYRENVESGIIYVELSDAKKKLIKRTLLYSEENEFAGQMELSDSLPSGYYHLRAYTNWMRNAGEDYFYRRDIYIGNTTDQKQEVTPLRTFDYQVTFFPEGGRLLAEVSNKVAFKSLGNDGLGTEITGTLFDPEGKELLRFKSLHWGMGNFSFTPEKGKTYKVFVQSNGIQKEYTLSATPEGLALSVQQDEKSVHLTIRSAGDEPETIYLIGQSKHIVCYALEGFTEGANQKVSVDKTKFPTGIVQFTLFKSSRPVSERLVFINRKDDLQVTVVPDKEKYGDREKVTVRIRAFDKTRQPVEADFSLSVTDDKIVKPSINEQNIKGSLLLDADLKGYIESPGWYFAGDEPERAEALDNLLCTQGWSRFVWDKLTVPPTSDFYPVEDAFTITGKVTNMMGKPIQNASVNLLSNENIPGTTTTDENGLFGFYGFNCPEGASFVVQCQTKNSQKAFLGLKLDKPDNRHAQTNRFPLTKKYDKDIEELRVSYMEQAARQMKTQEDIRTSNLPEWVVNLSKTKAEDKKTTEQRTIGVRSYHFGEKTLNKKTSIAHVLQTLPEPARGPFSLFTNPPPTWYIVDDGMKMDLKGFTAMYGSWNATLFESIDVLCAEDAITFYGLEYARGVYVLKTKKTIEGNNVPDASVQVYRPEGYCVRKEFYVPAYDQPDVREDPTPDLRTTVYWNPVIRTNREGRAEISFYTADNVGSYSYVLEGIGDNKIVFTKVQTK